VRPSHSTSTCLAIGNLDSGHDSGPQGPSLAGRPGDINQALIELGSTVCKVTDPKCGECPIQSHCLAHTRHTKVKLLSVALFNSFELSQSSEGPPDIEDICDICVPYDEEPDVTSYPMKVDKKKPREESDLVLVLQWRSRSEEDPSYFLRKRSEHGVSLHVMQQLLLMAPLSLIENRSFGRLARISNAGKYHPDIN
jgi:adenine-specific DNA glycosylase